MDELTDLFIALGLEPPTGDGWKRNPKEEERIFDFSDLMTSTEKQEDGTECQVINW